jgi:CAAX prenyl protease-like protein
MNAFISYLKNYFREIRLLNFLLTSFFVAILIILNYTVGIEKRIIETSSWLLRLASFFIFYLLVFSTAYFLQSRKGIIINEKNKFIFFLLIASLLFSLKIIHWNIFSLTTEMLKDPWDRYLSIILQLPVKLLMIIFVMFLIWKSSYEQESFFGFTSKQFNAKPYLLMLLCVVPLIIFASTQQDFLRMYPKAKTIYFINDYTNNKWLLKLIYEISYGLDFVSIELFFRGFLVIGFIRFAGINTILPMAAFYCTIHFGKPLAECISSYFGGIILGVLAYRTKSILGGLMVHLGLAWMMEIGGYASLLYFNSH